MPRFYLGNWADNHYCFDKTVSDTINDDEIKAEFIERKTNYLLFIEEEDLESRVNKFKAIYPKMEFLIRIDPSYVDRLLHYLNPRNQNEVIFIYKKQS